MTLASGHREATFAHTIETLDRILGAIRAVRYGSVGSAGVSGGGELVGGVDGNVEGSAEAAPASDAEGDADAGGKADADGARGGTMATGERAGVAAAGARRAAIGAAALAGDDTAGAAFGLGLELGLTDGAVTSVARSVGVVGLASVAVAGGAALSRDAQAASVFGRAATTTRATTAAMTSAPMTQVRFPEACGVFSSVAAQGDAVSPCGPVTTSRRGGGISLVGPTAVELAGSSQSRVIRASVGAERSGANSASADARAPTSAWRAAASFSRHIVMTAARPGGRSARSIGGAGRTSTAVQSWGSPSSWNGGFPAMSS